MITSPEYLSKLDDNLRYVLNQSGYAGDQLIPVALVTAGGDLEQVAAAVQRAGGTVRHMLPLVQAVAAWVPLSAIATLTQIGFVQEIELDEQVHIA